MGISYVLSGYSAAVQSGVVLTTCLVGGACYLVAGVPPAPRHVARVVPVKRKQSTNEDDVGASYAAPRIVPVPGAVGLSVVYPQYVNQPVKERRWLPGEIKAFTLTLY